MTINGQLLLTQAVRTPCNYNTCRRDCGDTTLWPQRPVLHQLGLLFSYKFLMLLEADSRDSIKQVKESLSNLQSQCYYKARSHCGHHSHTTHSEWENVNMAIVWQRPFVQQWDEVTLPTAGLYQKVNEMNVNILTVGILNEALYNLSMYNIDL